MRRIAIFVEGQTERIFIEKFLIMYLGYHKIKVKSWKELGVRGRECKAREPNLHADYYFLIYDVGGDAKVNSALKERAETMIHKHGYDYLLGLRDVYDEYSRSEIPAAIQGFNALFQHCSFRRKLRLIFAIMEIEAWFLADYNVFERIHASLTPEFIKEHLGLDLVNDDPQNYDHPAAVMNSIYKLVCQAYKKREKQAYQVAHKLDYDYLVCSEEILLHKIKSWRYFLDCVDESVTPEIERMVRSQD